MQNRRLANENIRLQKAALYSDRNLDIESKLADWPEALKLFGIDADKAKNDDGISVEQISYLTLSIHSLHSHCKTTGESLYEHISQNDYRQRMFGNIETRATWKYARLLFSDYIRSGVDQYLLERYPDS